MFSGIIEALGTVQDAHIVAGGSELEIRAPGYWRDVTQGASVAIDGVCLTLTRADENEASFDVIAETMRRTTLGTLHPGDRVNLQKSLAVGDRIDGHFVQGHVDAVAEVVRVEESPAEALWWFRPPAEALRYIVPKGSIAIDGISLTIAAVQRDAFSVALIPTTLARTTLGRKKAGARVNIETDILARTLVHYLESVVGAPGTMGGSLTLEKLRQEGFA
ncbi:MAG TPA: riboflavin synthase [Phycisphaerae bacterium]|nr:riboflavin synthase [Phycisphaerae bacterium]